jgi:hypothetical protein
MQGSGSAGGSFERRVVPRFCGWVGECRHWECLDLRSETSESIVLRGPVYKLGCSNERLMLGIGDVYRLSVRV